MTGTKPDPNAKLAGSSLWLQEVNERVNRSGIETLGSESQILGLVGGYERMGLAGGALGLTLAYFNASETDSAAAVGEHVVASMVEAGLYYRRAAGPFTFSARGAGGYAWFSSDRRFLAPAAATNTTGASNIATSNWGGVFFEGHAGASYERKFGRFYARPELSVDYLRLQEGAQAESGGGPGFDLNIDPRTSTRFSGQAVLVLGEQWGKSQWLRTEIQAGFREIFAGDVGDTTAFFARRRRCPNPRSHPARRRSSVAEIAERVGLSSSPCWRRIKRLEDAGVIQRRVTILDREKLGLGFEVYCTVKLSLPTKDNLDAFERAVTKLARGGAVRHRHRRGRLRAAHRHPRHARLRRVPARARSCRWAWSPTSKAASSSAR